MNRTIEKGIIILGVGGLYTVLVNDTRYKCKARGLFRKQRITPMVGDYVDIELNSNDNYGYIIKIHERRNTLVRPFVSNIDKLFIVIAVSKPKADFMLLDKLLICCEKIKIEPIIIINKCDEAEEQSINEIVEDYRYTGYKTYCVSAKYSDGIDELKNELCNATICFAGQSAVGKSSLMNALIPGLKLETGELSAKSERGRHTTRRAELIPIQNNCALLDTPGFSLLDNIECEPSEIKKYYPEFNNHVFECKFTDCMHLSEPGCKIKSELLDKEISRGRYDRYVRLVNEAVENEKHKYE